MLVEEGEEDVCLIARAKLLGLLTECLLKDGSVFNIVWYSSLFTACIVLSTYFKRYTVTASRASFWF